MSARWAELANRPATSLVVAALVVLCCALAQRPPAPLPEDAPEVAFSAHRAAYELDGLLDDMPARPRHTGSVAHAQARARLIGRFEAMGLKPRTTRTRLCRRVCAEVEGLIVPVLPGDGPAIVLSAHDDSVLAGPGVSDDLAGVAAILEITRALLASARTQQAPTTRHPVLVWITDGEELGLLGAHALGDEGAGHFVINLEARGTTGRSFAFETGSAQAETLALVAQTSRRPALNTIADEVYRRLPNSTDLAVHMAHGRQGVNLGYFKEVSRYHTPRDDRAHLDLASLQHSGEQALGLARALMVRDALPVAPADPAAARIVAADVLGLLVARWPEGRTMWLAALALLLWLGVLARWWCLGALSWRALGWSAITLAVAGVGSVSAGALIEVGLRLVTGHPAPWRGAWEVALELYACAAIATTLLTLRALGPRASAYGLWLCGGALLCALALASARWLEAGSAVCVLSALAWSAGGLVGGWRDRPHDALWLATWALAALLWTPLTLTLQAALELPINIIFTAPVTLLMLLATPALLGWSPRATTRAAMIAGLGALIGAIVVATPPHATVDRPEPVSLILAYPADAPPQQLLWRSPLTLTAEVAPLPAPQQAHATPTAQHETPLRAIPFYMAHLDALPITPHAAPPRPTVEALADLPTHQAALIRARSHREATTLLLETPAGEVLWLPASAKAQEDTEVIRALRGAEDLDAGCLALGGPCITLPRRALLTGAHPTRGVRLLLRRGATPNALLLSDLTPGHPHRTPALTSRPPWAVGAHLGDTTIVAR